MHERERAPQGPSGPREVRMTARMRESSASEEDGEGS